MELAGRRVVVVGFGASGRAAAALCVARGADVVAVDTRQGLDPVRGVRLELGPHRRETFLAAERIVVSPGVPPTQPDLAAAEAAGVPVTGELALAAALLPDRPVVGITGTNGKSSVTSFTGQLLAEAGLRPFVGGNLGEPLSSAVPRRAGEAPDWDVAVVECSSYQLERVGGFRPRVGVILNLTPDHLERHGTMPAYAAAKAALFANQGHDDLALIPHDHTLLRAAVDGVGEGRRAWLGARPGVVRDDDAVLVDLPGVHATLDLSVLPLAGATNRDNAAVAAALALALGASAEAVQRGLGTLRALPHRMQTVHEAGDIAWIDDSKATNVEAARAGISGLERPAVVLLGGQAKRGDAFAALAPSLAGHRAVVAFGGSGPAIAEELREAGVDVVLVDTLAAAVTHARTVARPGEAVLLSPGCASFDAFTNFEHRGRVFAALAREDAP